MTYEEAIKRLEEISQALSSDSVSLDEAVKLFEESTKLSKICFETIKNVETKVSLIKKELDEIKEKPFSVE
ncbi:MAG: exodeoxyribonuclease VII small subunit [Clostridia bacterium]|nr:exodeoxyribonuclease VII small subunit [Clostridia bacterium]